MLKVNGVSFKGTETPLDSLSTVSIPANQGQETSNKKISTKTKVAIGTGLAALAAVGIYIATKGKNKKVAEEVKNNVSEQIKEYTMDAFKKDNKFVKGKAQLANGEMFTGKITGTNTTGNYVMEYENGLLKSSVVKNGDDIVLQKNYLHDENGLKTITDGEGKNILTKEITEDNIMTVTRFDKEYLMPRFYIKDLNNNKLLRTNLGDYFYRPDGTLKYFKKSGGGLTLFHADGKTPKIAVSDKATFFDEHGKKQFDFYRDSTEGGCIKYPDEKSGTIYSKSMDPQGCISETLRFGEGDNKTFYEISSYFDPQQQKEMPIEWAFLKRKVHYDFNSGKYTLKEGEQMTAEIQKYIETDPAKCLRDKFKKDKERILNLSEQVWELGKEISAIESKSFKEWHYID